MEKLTYKQLKQKYKNDLNLDSFQIKKIKKPEKAINKINEQISIIKNLKKNIGLFTNELIQAIQQQFFKEIKKLQKDKTNLKRIVFSIKKNCNLSIEKLIKINTYNISLENPDKNTLASHIKKIFSL